MNRYYLCQVKSRMDSRPAFSCAMAYGSIFSNLLLGQRAIEELHQIRITAHFIFVSHGAPQYLRSIVGHNDYGDTGTSIVAFFHLLRP